MQPNFIKTLHCPYSGGRFAISSVIGESACGIEYAVLSSEGGEFPIVDGILRLKLDEYRPPLVDLIKNKKPAQALLTAMDPPVHSRFIGAVGILDRAAHKLGLNGAAQALAVLKRPWHRALTEPSGTLAATAKRLGSKSWADWQIYRFSMPAFMPTYPLLHLIQSGPVLDFGCGVGHASFLISRKVPAAQISCADYQFSALYLARKFFAGGANFFCLDGNYLLPFESAYFSTVFSSDALHLIDSKVSLAREFQRVVSGDGAVILPHLHNLLSPVRFGKSLSPEGYGALFDAMNKRVIPEDWLVTEFICNDTLDLEREWTPRELKDAIKGLSIVAGRNPSLFQRHRGLWERHVERMLHPIVNPLYRADGDGGKTVLRKEVPAPKDKLDAGGGIYLPETAVLPAAPLELKASDREAFVELAKQFVIVDAPERF